MCCVCVVGVGNGRVVVTACYMYHSVELEDSEIGQVAGLEWNGMHEVEVANCPSCTTSRVPHTLWYAP